MNQASSTASNLVTRQLLPLGLACALPGQALAQAGTTGILNIALGVALVLTIALLVWVILKLKNVNESLATHEAQLAEFGKERDQALTQLSQQTRELETQLGQHIQALETENDELSEATAKLRKLVVVDEITGLSNRIHFDQVLPHEIKRALREEKSLSIILGRFDFAQSFLDAYGKDRFNEALLKIADEVRTIFKRAGDLPARYDDSALAIIFTSDGDVAVRFAERLRKAIWNIPIPHEGSETADRVTFSIGVATVSPNKIHDPAEFRGAAEKAAAIAAEKGGNQVEDYRKPPAEPAAI